MKFFTVFTAIATIAKVSYVSALCGTQCNPKDVPNVSLSGNLELIQKNYKSLKGTITIENDCVFTVKGFQIEPAPAAGKWYGAKTKDAFEGIVLTPQQVGGAANPTDLSYNIEKSDTFCHASLIKDIGEGGVFRLMDGDTLIATAVMKAGSTPSSGSSSGSTNTKPTGSTNSSNPAANSTPTVAGNNTASSNPSKNTQNSGAISLKAPSVALYIALFVFAFLRL